MPKLYVSPMQQVLFEGKREKQDAYILRWIWQRRKYVPARHTRYGSTQGVSNHQGQQGHIAVPYEADALKEISPT